MNSCPTHTFVRGVGLEILRKRSDISILVAFSSGHFRSRGGGVMSDGVAVLDGKTIPTHGLCVERDAEELGTVKDPQ